MSDLYQRRLATLSKDDNLVLLKHSLHGIEREALRVDLQGQLAQTAHPKALGSALTNDRITTDYSEALLEFITPALANSADTLQALEETHRFTLSKLQQEVLWAPSMPCFLPPDSDIPMAYYGTSNIGRFKYVYRSGLAVRYGKAMQCIAGIHYNYSLPESVWQVLHDAEQSPRDLQDYQSFNYIGLTRNFRRYNWLLMYLFGASPAVDKSFLRDHPHQLEELDQNTLYLPYATSLRMSDLGYQSKAQAALTPCYNDLNAYITSLRNAVMTPYPAYQAIGTRHGEQWIQLNTNIIQIENEYYSSIRPKRVMLDGERPIEALAKRGVQYIEARCIDVNPFLPLGIDLPQARFLDIFLLFCALHDSPLLTDGECPSCTDNFLTVVNYGRKPGLMLERRHQAISLVDWAKQLFEQLKPCAELLDKAYNTQEHSQALAMQYQKVEDVSLTPSAQVLAYMREHQQSFTEFSLAQSQQHAKWLREHPLNSTEQAEFEQHAQRSLATQEKIEADDQGDFAQFVADYMDSVKNA